MRLAAQGLRNLDTGKERIEDPGLVAQLRQKANWVHLEALCTAGVLTGLSLALPGG